MSITKEPSYDGLRQVIHVPDNHSIQSYRATTKQNIINMQLVQTMINVPSNQRLPLNHDTFAPNEFTEAFRLCA